MKSRSLHPFPIMKIRTLSLLTVAGLATVSPAARAAEESSPPKEEKKFMRVLTGPERERRGFAPRDAERRDKGEKEVVAFLGVETNSVSPTLSAQLALARGTGLVVNHVVAKSPADGVLKEHDILLQLDDQILIETRQLAVLIRSRKEGDEVTVTYLRGGQKSTARIRLGKTEVPKLAAVFGAGAGAFAWEGPADRLEFFRAAPGTEAERVEVDGVLSMMQRSRSGEPFRMRLEPGAGPGFRAVAINTGNSSLAFSDDEGSLELTNKDGIKTLVATNADGTEAFAGTVTTPEERRKMPAFVRERLEKLEGMRDITFRTDGDFKGAEMKVLRPRGIAFPNAPRVPAPPIRPAFF